LAGAHAECNSMASSAGLSGSFKAWLSTSATGPASFMTHSSIPYVRVDGEIIANNWADLTDGSLSNPIQVTETGDPTSKSIILTGRATVAGLPTSHTCGSDDCTCGSWTRSSNTGEMTGVGSANAVNAAWTDYSTVNICHTGNGGYPIYCFEQ